MYEPRTYRRLMKREGMKYFSVTHKETDLYIGIPKEDFSCTLPQKITEWVAETRQVLESYIEKNREFLTSLEPVRAAASAPPVVKKMVEASISAGVGPMAAVAGAFSQEIGERIERQQGVKEVIVENGGDIYLNVSTKITVGIYAGNSPLSNRISCEISPDKMPLGICTSAGTIGHSMSFGKADAVVVMSPSTFYADAYATAIGNKITEQEDLAGVLAWAKELPQITGIIIMVGEKLGIWGGVKLVPGKDQHG